MRCYKSFAYEKLGLHSPAVTRVRRNPSLSSKTSRRIDIRQKTLKACLCTNCACVCVRERKRNYGSDGNRQQVQARMRERGICMMRSVLVSVGFGLLLHGAMVLCRHLRHTRSLNHACSRALSLLSSLAVIPRCMFRLCSRIDVCAVGKIRNFKQ